ncbi:MAG: histidine phosphatase family protein [Candidatus Sumerlaeota bacterium]
MPLPRIYLVRHGETDWSLSGQHTGLTDIPLTSRGEAQASSLATSLATSLGGIEFSAVYTSPLQRARQTCELAGFGTHAKVDARLVEWDYGDYEGKLSSDIQLLHPGWKVFQHGAPGGESPVQVSARADAVIAELKHMEGNVLVFSHGHFLRSFVARWLNFPIVEGLKFRLGVAAISIVSFDHENIEEPVVDLWNSKR